MVLFAFNRKKTNSQLSIIVFVRKHYTPEGLKYSIQRSKNKKNENHVVGSFSDVKWSKIVTISGDKKEIDSTFCFVAHSVFI